MSNFHVLQNSTRTGGNDVADVRRSLAPRLLVVDEDRAIQRFLHRELTAAGYEVQEVVPAEAALECIIERQFDLLILDIDTSVGGGCRAIHAVRKISPVPILALSTHGGEDATADALDAGADDFVQKPFGIRELLARVKNALRRGARERGQRVQFVSGDLEIDLIQRRVRSHGHDVHLSPKCYEVLRVLAENAGKVITFKEVLCAVWGPQRANRVQYLRTAIRGLRCKLEDNPSHPRHIVTAARVGYRLNLDSHDG